MLLEVVFFESFPCLVREHRLGQVLVLLWSFKVHRQICIYIMMAKFHGKFKFTVDPQICADDKEQTVLSPLAMTKMEEDIISTYA